MPALAALLDEARALADAPTEAPAGPWTGGVPPWLGPDAAMRRGLGAYLDHTLLKPEATAAQVAALCDEGRRYGVAAVCVNGRWVADCVAAVAGSPVRVAAVVGFPLGAMHPAAKADEARRAVAEGATEIDMVVSLGDLKAGAWERVADDIRGVVEASGAAGVKVILETAALDRTEIAAASLVSARAGAAFVKTSTGFHAAGGASVEAVALMRRAVGPVVGVKASGGVRTAEAVVAMLRAGANRIGTSSTTAMAAHLGPDAPDGATLLATLGTAAPVLGGGYG